MPSPPFLFTLSVVSGPLAGREFPLGAEGEFMIGRSEARLDVPLRDVAVSREHARIFLRNGQVRLRDSRSSNGCFVNGTRVTEALLRAGDRLTLGGTTLSLRAHLAYAVPPAASGRTPVRASLAGTIPETSLDDVLRMLVSLQKDAVVHLRTESRAACIRVAHGKVRQAVIRGANFLPPRKALYRVLAWEKAEYETHHALPCEDAIREPLEGLLLEGSRQRDELARLREQIPSPASILVIGVNALPPLTIEEQIVIHMVAHHRLMQAVLNRSPLDDATTAATVVMLQRRDLLAAVEPSRGAFLVPDARHAVFGRRGDPTPTRSPSTRITLTRLTRPPESSRKN